MDFRLRLPYDCPVRHEFDIEPAEGSIPPGESFPVTITLDAMTHQM